jgi:hypothetical protein
MASRPYLQETVRDRPRLRRPRVPFTIATDGPEITRTQLREEFELRLWIGEIEGGLLEERTGAGTRRASCGDLTPRKG